MQRIQGGNAGGKKKFGVHPYKVPIWANFGISYDALSCSRTRATVFAKPYTHIGQDVKQLSELSTYRSYHERRQR